MYNMEKLIRSVQVSNTFLDFNDEFQSGLFNNVSTLIFYVNGIRIVERNVDPEVTLLSYLRLNLRLCGSKLGCGEGGCGACTVMVSSSKGKNTQPNHISVNACLIPLAALHGLAVTTVEGIGSTRTKLHPVQQRIADAHGSQCGFCTPGIVMSMYTLLRNNPKPTMEDIMTYFQGNLCRCTGYRPILEAYRTFTQNASELLERESAQLEHQVSTSNNFCCIGDIEDGCIAQCCKNKSEYFSNPTSLMVDKFNEEWRPFREDQEPIFPRELELSSQAFSSEFLIFKGRRMKWFRPVNLTQTMMLKDRFQQDAKIVIGNTEIGIEMKFQHFKYPIMIHTSQISELNEVVILSNGVKIGASVSLSQLKEICVSQISQNPLWKVRVFTSISKMLHLFAGKQIRNVASIGGNIVTASPISDLNPILMAAAAQLEIVGRQNEKRNIFMDKRFFTAYRKTILAPHEILLSITIPYTAADEYFVAYKQSRRREDDISIVTSAFYFDISSLTHEIKVARIAYGGMAPTTKMAEITSKLLESRLWNPKTFENAFEVILKDFPLPPDVPGSMVEFRQSLAISFLFKAFQLITELRENYGIEKIKQSNTFFKKSAKFYDLRRPDHLHLDPIGRPMKHKSADKHATGEAVYVDDIPILTNELFIGLVLSSRSHAKIIKINTDEALSQIGVYGFLTYRNLKCNRISLGIVSDELVFAEDEVYAVGQIIGAIIATDQKTAQDAAQLVKVVYKDLPSIVTIEQAIVADSYHNWPNNKIHHGDVDEAFHKCSCFHSGTMITGAQEHFYMEPQAVIAVSIGEDGEVQLNSTTQHVTEVQYCVAKALDIDMNKVKCVTRRIGGGFGGKETRNTPLTIIAAITALKFNRSARLVLDRDVDMLITGQRHPFKANYKIGFDKNGKILVCDIDLYCNAGWTMDLSFAVMEKAMWHCTNAYQVLSVRVKGHLCKTNIASNTAFRGFGAPQSMMMVETWIDEIAHILGKDSHEVRQLNLYKEGETTFYNMPIKNCTLQRCWSQCMAQSCYDARLIEIKKFNISNRWRKRGLSIIPVMFGISFGANFLNQSGALIHVYYDGSVLLTHAGIEMGQGLHTKTIQVASKVLGVHHSKIHISEVSTDKVPNTSATAASLGSDLNCAAVLNACQTILERLQSYQDLIWEEKVANAYRDRISLSATGFHKITGYDYNYQTQSGSPHIYFTFGVGCSEVEIDCLTGDHSVVRTDIVMDLGESINPAIDIGQIEGAFMQGYGLFVMEQMLHSPEGSLLTIGPGKYKIPGFGDIPSEFNVSLLRGASNPRAVYSSKAVGEPPLFLAASIFFAIKEAIRATRSTKTDSIDLKFYAPATAERIRNACLDELTARVPSLPSENSYRPWAIQL